MALSNRVCYHRWSREGRCVSPGCFASRPKEELLELSHPNALPLELRGQVLALLPALNNREIAARVGIDPKTVAKVRREEAGG